MHTAYWSCKPQAIRKAQKKKQNGEFEAKVRNISPQCNLIALLALSCSIFLPSYRYRMRVCTCRELFREKNRQTAAETSTAKTNKHITIRTICLSAISFSPSMLLHHFLSLLQHLYTRKILFVFLSVVFLFFLLLLFKCIQPKLFHRTREKKKKKRNCLHRKRKIIWIHKS